MATNKYHAEPTYINRLTNDYTEKSDPYAIYFGSRLEAHTYRILTRSGDRLVSRQHKILINKETEFFPASYWQCDFRLFTTKTDENDPYLPPLNVESKGLFFDTFQYKLQLLANYKPDEIANLLLVVDDSDFSLPRAFNKLIANKQVVSISNLNKHLITLGY